jgi:hypothetical protein
MADVASSASLAPFWRAALEGDSETLEALITSGQASVHDVDFQVRRSPGAVGGEACGRRRSAGFGRPLVTFAAVDARLRRTGVRHSHVLP